MNQSDFTLISAAFAHWGIFDRITFGPHYYDDVYGLTEQLEAIWRGLSD